MGVETSLLHKPEELSVILGQREPVPVVVF